MDYVKADADANALLEKIKAVLIHDDDEPEPENEDTQKVKTLDFFRWVEASGITLPKKVVDSLYTLIHMEYYEKEAAENLKRNFPQLTKAEFDLLAPHSILKCNG